MELRDLGSQIKSEIVFGDVLDTEREMRVVVTGTCTFLTWGMEERTDGTGKLSGARGKSEVWF